ncbi:MAG TPA: DUF3426 domain-containing protein [Burkholderiales bacterium]
MSMLTRCPECGTSFRITTDQLVSRQGKVRCGRCQHVFSALASLVHTRDPVTTTDPYGALNVDSRFSVLDANSRPMESVAFTPPEEPAEAGQAQATDEAGAAAQEADPDAPLVARPLQRLARKQKQAEEAEAEEAEQRSRRRFAWFSFAGVLLALLVLAGQGVYFYRNQLAVLQPEVKPWLAQMCERLHCKLQTPVDPQAISIESSALEADPADPSLLQLSALLRNRSALAQQLPYLELTLIDAQEAPQARRVIRPEEYGGSSSQPQLGANGEFQVRLSIDASQLKASGYRLYAFYP